MQPYYDTTLARKQITTFGVMDAAVILIVLGIVAGGGYLIYRDIRKRRESA